MLIIDCVKKILCGCSSTRGCVVLLIKKAERMYSIPYIVRETSGENSVPG